MMNVVSEYFEITDKYKKEKGENTIVIMQIGSFYEMYGVDNEQEKLGNVAELSSLLNIALTKRNKKIPGNSRSNPLMIGFPCVALSKYIQVFLESDYTLVVVDQVKSNSKISRFVSQVISPSTYIESNSDGYLVLVYIECHLKKLHIGISAVNVVTGKNVVYECHSKEADTHLPLDETLSFLQQYRPLETVVCYIKTLEKSVTDYLNSISFTKIIQRKVKRCFTKLAYQEFVLSSVFPNKTMLSVIELINMEKLPFSVISYTLIIDFLYSHNPMLIKKMLNPIIHTENKALILANNTVEQLDIIYKSTSKKGISSLFDVLNYCSTPGGKRLLKERLLLPINDTREITRRLDLVESFGNIIGENRELESLLSRVGDIDRLKRKISINAIKPGELAKMCDSCSTILEIHCFLIRLSKCRLIILDKKGKKKLESFIGECHDTLDMDDLRNGEISFKPLVIREFDEISAKISEKLIVIKSVAKKVSEKVGEVKIELLPTSGYHISVSNFKAKKLDDSSLIIQRGKSVSKITSLKINEANAHILELKNGLKKCVNKYFGHLMDSIHTKYSDILAEAASALSELDLTRSLYIAATKNGYCKPTISLSEYGLIKAQGLRHPIIEKINTAIKYVPNDIDLSGDNCGIVLYSINAGGKTSLLKACGLCIILAQIGSYVPADSFEFYPFNRLSTRIISENSVLYGKSSFVSEMLDLRSILRRSDRNTLVLADEITNGTEHVSGSAIFASSVITLANRNTKFLFTTHLHGIYPFIKDVPKVRVFHLSMTIDKNSFIFNHKLCSGPGSSMYGLEVCDSLDMDTEFLTTAFFIRNKVDWSKSGLSLATKNSRYNKQKIVQVCQVCGYSPKLSTDIPLDVHHILSQCLSDNKKMIGNIHKNTLCNLAVLCKDCHNKVHEGQLTIHGYSRTTEGTKLITL